MITKLRFGFETGGIQRGVNLMGIVYEVKTAEEISAIPIPVGKLKLCNLKFRDKIKLSLLSVFTRYISIFPLGSRDFEIFLYFIMRYFIFLHYELLFKTDRV